MPRRIFLFCILLLALAALYTLASVWITVERIGRLDAAGKATAQSQQVLSALHAFATAAVDIESSARGYALTGNEAYLQPFEAARRQAPLRGPVQRLAVHQPGAYLGRGGGVAERPGNRQRLDLHGRRPRRAVVGHEDPRQRYGHPACLLQRPLGPVAYRRQDTRRRAVAHVDQQRQERRYANGPRQRHRPAEVRRRAVRVDQHRVRQQRHHPDPVHLPAGPCGGQRHLATAVLGRRCEHAAELRDHADRHGQRQQALGDLGHPGHHDIVAGRARWWLQRAEPGSGQTEGAGRYEYQHEVLRAVPRRFQPPVRVHVVRRGHGHAARRRRGLDGRPGRNRDPGTRPREREARRQLLGTGLTRWHSAGARVSSRPRPKLVVAANGAACDIQPYG